MLFDVNDESGHIILHDNRVMLPIVVRDLKTNKSMILSESQTVTVKGKTITFTPPNNISLCLNKSFQEMLASKKIYKNLFVSKLENCNKFEFKTNDDGKMLYDYFEHIETSIIFAYTSVESFINIAIPKSFQYESPGRKKGIKEIWDKDSIERWLGTKDKIRKVLTIIFNIKEDDILNSEWWSNFTKLELIRNEIIHQKTNNNKTINTTFLQEFVNEDIYSYLYSAFALIKYFCKKDNSNPAFPYGFCEMKLPIIELDNFDNYFKILDDNTNDERSL